MDGIGSFTELLRKVSAPGFLRYSRLPEATYPPEFPLPALQILDRDLRRLTLHFFLFPSMIACIEAWESLCTTMAPAARPLVEGALHQKKTARRKIPPTRKRSKM
jgi:hypothetical protein